MQRVAHQEEIGGDGVAHQRRRELGCGHEVAAVFARMRADLVLHVLRRQIEIRRAREGRGWRDVSVDDGRGAPLRQLGNGLGAGGHHDVATQ